MSLVRTAESPASPADLLTRRSYLGVMFSLALLAIVIPGARPALAQTDAKPNIIVIMGDDIGWFNIGAYHRGMMAGKTPNLDKLASEGMIFNAYYAEASSPRAAPISSPANCPSAPG